jgi:hypothetical protein
MMMVLPPLVVVVVQAARITIKHDGDDARCG